MADFTSEDLAKGGHRPETILYVESVRGKVIPVEQFVSELKAATGVRMPPHRAKQLYRYLIKMGFILSN